MWTPAVGSTSRGSGCSRHTGWKTTAVSWFVEHAVDLVQEMADALANLDGLRLLAPAPRRLAFPERLTTYLEAEFPLV
jgi:hypothetical protein